MSKLAVTETGFVMNSMETAKINVQGYGNLAFIYDLIRETCHKFQDKQKSK